MKVKGGISREWKGKGEVGVIEEVSMIKVQACMYK
jgi:hypothetical protein